jgi:hypothetical protein
MAKKGQYKKNASKETIRQRKKNQKPHQMKKRVKRNKARRKAIRERKVTRTPGGAGNPGRKPEVDHHKGGTRIISHKKNRSRDNQKNHKRKRKA